MSQRPNSQFRTDVEALMAQVPAGCVTTYGDLAALAGHPYASRIVGGMAHYGNPELPWHRLVNRFGGVAVGYPGGQEAQRQLLAQDGVECSQEYRIKDFGVRRWRPQ